VHYGKAQIALRDVTLTVPDGAAVAVLGANGAGKSTLTRALSGTLGHHRGTVDAGTITYDGRSLRGLDAAGIVAAGVVQVPEGRRIFTTLTVEENLRAGAVLVCATGPPEPAYGTRCTRSSPYSRSAGSSAPVSSPAANSRCSPSGGH